MDGEKHMNTFLKNYGEDFDKDRFQVYGKCISYKPEIGKWYHPAFGEMNVFIKNLMFIHAAAWLTGINMFLLPEGCYWTSSERCLDGCWIMRLNYEDTGCGWCYRCDRYKACFFLASTNNIPKVKINYLTTKKEDKYLIKKTIKTVKKYVGRLKNTTN